MARPTILADENIPYAREAFGTLGEVRLKHGRHISRADLADVDLLVVRSITRVGEALVAGTCVRFVGTATSGADHLAIPDLERLGIAWCAALGCNANAVAEYLTAACRFLGVEPIWSAAAAVPPRPEGLPLRGFARGDAALRYLDREGVSALADAVAAVYPVLRDDEALRRTAGMDAAERGRAFDLLRKAYPTRREFSLPPGRLLP